MNQPVLYSFRRCPYAMRARMALRASDLNCEVREIVLKAKPESMLAASPKGTVPVLVLGDADHRVIDESLDIMLWALEKNDPQGWLADWSEASKALVRENDGPFKQHLDKYKYADRFPEQSAEAYRTQGEAFLEKLDLQLQAGNGSAFLGGTQPGLVDVAIFPFVRQFAHVDKDWFYQTRYQHLITWLDALLASDLFTGIMPKIQPWQPGDTPLMLRDIRAARAAATQS